jgi:DNA repair protein RecN (Recombination protein N)
MLQKIEIQNYAIIEKLEISFSEGLTIITGETGAGKSILLGALGLIMGKRADTKVLYIPDIKCIVEAVFDISGYDLQPFFESEGLDFYTELSIRREIAPNGKSRAFINDTPVTLETLNTLTDELIDIHQQFDTLDIQKPAFQLQLIDALAGNYPLLKQYSQLFNQYKRLISTLDELKLMSKNTSKETEFLNFQLQEFVEANLKPNEQEELEAELKRLTAAEDIKKNCALLVQGIEDDQFSIQNQLLSLISQFGSIKQLDQKYLSIYDRLLSVKEELSDMAKEAAIIAENTEYDEESIHAITSRLNTIYRLEKKHQVANIEELIKIQQDITDKLNGYSDLTEKMQQLELEISTNEKQLRDLAVQLSGKRKSVFTSLESKVHAMLSTLAMEHARVQVACTPLSQFNPKGLDDISILFAPNKGSAFLPLKDTASGGELSRLALCLKSLIAGAMTLPTLIFDEIDSGVSGDVAHKMGKILAGMSHDHQLICITHSPQVAARANSHFMVYKNDIAHRTVTSMRKLDDEERILEIAKMLSGNPPTEIAKANARELIAS